MHSLGNLRCCLNELKVDIPFLNSKELFEEKKAPTIDVKNFFEGKIFINN